jgi:hypothetical protein
MNFSNLYTIVKPSIEFPNLANAMNRENELFLQRNPEVFNAMFPLQAKSATERFTQIAVNPSSEVMSDDELETYRKSIIAKIIEEKAEQKRRFQSTTFRDTTLVEKRSDGLVTLPPVVDPSALPSQDLLANSGTLNLPPSESRKRKKSNDSNNVKPAPDDTSTADM